eukprot:Partr_v1_DN23957_c0_g1_i1_m48955 putative Universal stress protein
MQHKKSKHIVCAIDFSECSTYAIEWTLENVQWKAGDRLTLLHVIDNSHGSAISAQRTLDPMEDERVASEKLKALWAVMVKKCGEPSVKVDLAVEHGSAKDILAAMPSVDEKPADEQHLVETMIIMGSHGKTGINRAMGSVSDHCMKRCRVPVIVVKEKSLV